MDHQKAFVELVTTKLGSTEHLSQTLMIPTATGQFKRANEMCLSTVLGVLLPLDRASIPNSVQRLTRQQNTVQWELFLTEIGVNIPRFLRESKMCYELPSLDSFSPQATKAAVKLLKKCSTDVLVYLSCQNILACTSTDTSKLELVPVQQVIDSGLAEFPLPHIRVEIEKRELAKLLRISIEPSSELIFKALAMLVSKKETQVSLYTPWLLQLQSKQFDNEFAFAEDWQDCNLLWIPESGGKQEGTWASPRSILIWQSQEHVTSAIKVARLLNKRIVCLRENTCYYHFSEALVKLGCKHLSVQDIVDGLAALYQQKSPAHFYYLQNGNMVSPVGKEEFRALYSLLEYQLAKMLNFPTEYTQYLIMNWQWRSKEIPAAIQRNAQLMQLNLKDFPVMLIKDKVIPFQDIKHSLFLMYSSTLESIIRQTNTNINFTDSSFVHNLPLSFAILRKKYIEAYATLTLVDFNSNREVYQPQASDIFAKVLEIDTIDVVQTTFVGTNLDIEFDAAREAANLHYTDDGFIPNSTDSLLCLNKELPNLTFVHPPGLVYVGIQTLDMGIKVGVLSSILSKCLLKHSPKYTPSEADALALREVSNVYFENTASRSKEIRDRSFRFIDCLVPELDFCSEELFCITDLPQLTADKTSSSNLEHPLPSSSSEFLVNKQYDWFESRLDVKLSSDLLTLTKEITSKRDAAQPIIMDENVKPSKEVGNLAEFTAFKLLKKHYGNLINFTNWVSSGRLAFYPDTGTSGIDDSLGFDFIFQDHLDIFTKYLPHHYNTIDKSKKKWCYLEVKGSADPWNGCFHMSGNELNKASEISERGDAFYVILVLQNVRHDVSIAKILPWCKSAVNYDPINYLVFPNDKRSSSSNRLTHYEVERKDEKQNTSQQNTEVKKEVWTRREDRYATNSRTTHSQNSTTNQPSNQNRGNEPRQSNWRNQSKSDSSDSRTEAQPQRRGWGEKRPQSDRWQKKQ